MDRNRFVVTPVIRGDGQDLVFRATLVSAGRQLVASARARCANGMPVVVPVPDARPSSPEGPYLYGFRLELLRGERMIDRVQSYAGLRKFHIEGNRLYLNNKPTFLRFVLDQGFDPDGIWTAPSDAALKRDIQLSMAGLGRSLPLTLYLGRRLRSLYSRALAPAYGVERFQRNHRIEWN